MPIVAFLPSSDSFSMDIYVGFLSRGDSFGLFSLAVPGLEARLRPCISRLYLVLHLTFPEQQVNVGCGRSRCCACAQASQV